MKIAPLDTGTTLNREGTSEAVFNNLCLKDVKCGAYQTGCAKSNNKRGCTEGGGVALQPTVTLKLLVEEKNFLLATSQVRPFLWTACFLGLSALQQCGLLAGYMNEILFWHFGSVDK